MIVADSFIKSSKARNNEFTTNKGMNHIFLKLNFDPEIPIQLQFVFVDSPHTIFHMSVNM
jgi:hypothetical protein